MHAHVHSSITYNSPKVETAEISIIYEGLSKCGPSTQWAGGQERGDVQHELECGWALETFCGERVCDSISMKYSE